MLLMLKDQKGRVKGIFKDPSEFQKRGSYRTRDGLLVRIIGDPRAYPDEVVATKPPPIPTATPVQMAPEQDRKQSSPRHVLPSTSPASVSHKASRIIRASHKDTPKNLYSCLGHRRVMFTPDTTVLWDVVVKQTNNIPYFVAGAKFAKVEMNIRTGDIRIWKTPENINERSADIVVHQSLLLDESKTPKQAN